MEDFLKAGRVAGEKKGPEAGTYSKLWGQNNPPPPPHIPSPQINVAVPGVLHPTSSLGLQWGGTTGLGTMEIPVSMWGSKRCQSLKWDLGLQVGAPLPFLGGTTEPIGVERER